MIQQCYLKHRGQVDRPPQSGQKCTGHSWSNLIYLSEPNGSMLGSGCNWIWLLGPHPTILWGWGDPPEVCEEQSSAGNQTQSLTHRRNTPQFFEIPPHSHYFNFLKNCFTQCLYQFPFPLSVPQDFIFLHILYNNIS